MCKYFAFAFEHFPGNVFPDAVCWERPKSKDRGKENENKTNLQLNMCQEGEEERKSSRMKKTSS